MTTTPTTYTVIGQWRCQACLQLVADCRCAPPQRKDHRPMFAPNTPMTLTDVRFTTEVIDEETRRIVECTFNIVPFTPQQADDLHIRSVLFDATSGQPKDAIATIVVYVDMPLQQMTWAMAPDQTDTRIVIQDAKVESKVRAKVKRDRDPLMVDASFKITFHYPTAAELLYIANGVNDCHFVTFEPVQRDLLTDDVDDEVRPGVFAEH